MTEPTPPTPAAANLPAPLAVVTPPRQQLGDLPIEELRMIAEEFGVDGKSENNKPDLIAAIHKRRQLIASLDRAAMIDVVHWAGKTPPVGAANEQLAIEIVQCRSMRFTGLSDRGLLAIALLRGAGLDGVKSRDELIKALKHQEGLFSKLKRKTRGWVGKRIQGIIGDETTTAPVGTPTPASPSNSGAPRPAEGPRQQALREEIEEAGFFGGIANRVKRQADSYVNQKLDEIEARIDRKLDEIDRRLAEWRDKEIANRIRILKITLWVSVVVAVISLIYSYVQVETKRWRNPLPERTPSTMRTQHTAPAGSTNNSVPITATLTNPSSRT